MKKIYLLVALCCLSFSGFAVKFYSGGGAVGVPANWNTSPTFTGTSATPADFANPLDTFIFQTNMSISSGTWNIEGTVIFTLGRLVKTGPSASKISIGGALLMFNNCFISTSFSAGPFEIDLYGDMLLRGNSYITTGISGTSTPNYASIHFRDTTATVLNPKLVEFNNVYPDTNRFVSLNFHKRCVRALRSNINMARLSATGDSLSGTLICGTYTINSANLDSFMINDGATIYTAHPLGIDGSIQNMLARHFSSAAHYIYNGTVPQITGLTLPSAFTAQGSVTVSNTTGVTLSQVTSFGSGSAVNLDKGDFILGGFLTMNGGSEVNVDAGNFDSNPVYDALVDVTYMGLESDTVLTHTTGYELLPTLPTTTIGKLTVNKALAGSVVTLGSNVTVNDSVVIDTLSSLDASSTGNYTIDAKGDWANYAGISAFVGQAGTVIFDGPATQHIGGTTPTTFSSVELNNANHAIIEDTIMINNGLTLTDGRLYINTQELIFGATATPVGGTFTSSNMIVANTAGHVRKLFGADGIFLFPVGDTNLLAANYSPITLSITAAGYATGADAAVNLEHLIHPNNVNVNDYLKRYWRVLLTGMTTPLYNVDATYVASDVNGSDANMSMGEYDGALPWLKYAAANTGTKTLTATAVTSSSAAFTGITTQGPTIVSSPGVQICTPSGTTTLTATSPTGDPTLILTWSPASGLSTTVGATTIATPAITTTYTVTITDGNGFTGFATTTVTVDPSPSLSGGAVNNGPLCDGADLDLVAIGAADVLTYVWTGPAAFTSGATTDHAIIAGATPAVTGQYSVTLTNGTGDGCTVQYTTDVVVNALPPATTVSPTSPGFVFCNSAELAADNGGVGNIYFQGTVSGGTDVSLGSTPQTVFLSGTYYFRARDPLTGCWGPEGSVTVTVNPLPTPATVTGGGMYCAGGTGVSVGLTPTESGISYQMRIDGADAGAPIVSTGADIDFGLQTVAGTYTVFATNPVTGCDNDMGSYVTITINNLPYQFPMSQDTGYCYMGTGAHIELLGTEPDPSVSYQLYYLDTTTGSVRVPVGAPLVGTGLGLDFGYFTNVGTYSVIATNFWGCTNDMLTTDSIWVFDLPHVYTLLPDGGTICADAIGFPLKLDTSAMGFHYQLYNDLTGAVGPSWPGNGSELNFGYQSGAGVYTVIATDDHSSCTNQMAGSDTIVVNPLPLDYTVSGGGSYCADDSFTTLSVNLGASEFGISYELRNFGVAVPGVLPIDGTGAAISFTGLRTPGFYEVVATNTTTLCQKIMTGSALININPLPTVYNISGSGHYCAGTTGVNLWLDGSQSSSETINYSIYADGVFVSSSMGDGSAPYSLGVQTIGGTYIAVANNVTTGCIDTMNGTATIVIDPLARRDNVTGGGEYCVNDTIAYVIGLDSSEVGFNYQVYRDWIAIGTPLAGTGSALSFGYTDTAGNYTVVATNAITGCVDTMTGSKNVIANGLPDLFTIFGGAPHCANLPGPTLSITGSQFGVEYQLYRNGVLWGTPVAGTGSPISLGSQDSAGIYTVSAENTTTHCTRMMLGTTSVLVLPVPTIYAIAGGGNFCTGDTGVHIFLSASVTGVDYQLFNGISLAGLPAAGTGAGLDYGLFTTPGTYTITGSNLYGCMANMAGSVTIGTYPLPTVYGVTGGDTICSGAPGVPLGLAGSNGGILYQLRIGGSDIGAPVDGTGSALSFGTFAVTGAYTVFATDSTTGCTSNMNGTAHIGVNPVPAVFACSGGGGYCAGGTGPHINLAGSQAGIVYQVYTGGIPIGGPIVGTGSPLDFFGAFTLAGTYVIKGTNPTTGCESMMSGSVVISIDPLPTRYNVTGGGTYCTGDTIGKHIGLSGSDNGVNYQLYEGAAASGSVVTGTGSILDFGLRLPAATYTAIATNPVTGCVDTMDGSAAISVLPYSVPVVTLAAHPGTLIKVGDMDTVVATVTGGGSNPTFEWVVNGNIIAGATNDTFSFAVYFDNDSIVCNVTSDGVCGGITTSKLIVIHLKPVSVKQIIPSNIDVRLVPNPNKGIFSLKGTLGTIADEDATVEVTNMMGQVVYKSTITSKNGSIDEQIQLNNMANGMYLLNLRSGTSNTVFHFVLEQ